MLKKASRKLGLLLLAADVASWLRMLNPRLAMLPWSELWGKPVIKWVVAIVVYPLFELLYSWPAYLLGGLLFVALRKLAGPLTLIRAGALGGFLGACIYAGYVLTTGELIMRSHWLLAEQLVVYTIAGSIFGLCYYWFVSKPSAAPSLIK
jgi:hypothetical protein